ncbi:MAG: hypothetical protein JXB13_22690 [Phycisphaerae bacterium]|nr:hypothetical protein [Phycisphaerae bacterium]
MPTATAAKTKIAWALNVSIEGGPHYTLAEPTPEVFAYDVIRCEVPAVAGGQNGKQTVAIQPDKLAKSVLFLTISADTYDDGLIYTVDDDSSPERRLDAPHVFLGAGAVALLADPPPQKLAFQSKLSNPVKVQIVIGRKAGAST